MAPTPAVYNYGGAVVLLGYATVAQNTIQNNASCGVDIEVSGVSIVGNHILNNTPTNTAGGDCRVNAFGVFVNETVAVGYENPPPVILISGNLIENNAYAGISFNQVGGDETILIEGNTIRGNGLGSALFNEGGINLETFNTVTVRNNLVYGNGGTGLTLWLGQYYLYNNTFFNNSLTVTSYQYPSSSGTELWGGSEGFVQAENNIFVGNNSATPTVGCGPFPPSLNSVGSGILALPNVFDHNLIYNTVTHTGSIGCDQNSTSYGNLFTDPIFRNAATNDLHLQTGSPAIDSGNNSVTTPQETDLEGQPRVQDATGVGYPIVDMGAYEASGLVDTPVTATVLTLSQTIVSAGTQPQGSVHVGAGTANAPGSVSLQEDGTTVGSATLDPSGNAVIILPPQTPGLHALVAIYAGAPGFSPGESIKTWLGVNNYPTTLTLSAPTPVILNQQVTISVSITSPDNAKLSPVTVTDSTTGQQLASLTPDASGHATFSTSFSTLGFHSLIANYNGDATHSGATASATVSVVSGIATTTTLTSSLNPSTYAQPVTFTATVTAQTGTSIPSGAILFSDGHTTLATIPLDASGIATFPTSALTANDLGTSAYHQIAAVFVPAAGFATSSASLNQVVNGLPSVAALTVTPGSGTPSTSFTLTAAVSSGTTSTTTVPTGRVLFYTSTQTGVSGNLLGYADLTNGVATFTSKGFLGGTDYILAVYMGDTIYAQANSNYVTLTVTTPTTTTTAAVSPEPSTYGQPVVFSTHVTGTNGPTGVAPTGQVEFDYCHGATYRVTLDASGNASYISPVGAGIAEPAGSCPFTAKYLGDANFPSSTSTIVPYIVLPSGSATTLTTSAANAYIGQPVTLTAAIAGTPAPVLGPGGIILPPATMQPTGTVAFTIHSATLGSATVTNGVATLVTTALPVGSSTVVATYAGDSDLTGSISGPITEIVTKPDFTLTAPQPAITIQSRHKSSMPLNFTSLTGFNGPITVSCVLPLPTWLTCEPPTVSLPLNGTATGTLTLDTDGVPNWYGDLRSPSNTTTGHGLATHSTLALTLLPLLGLASSRKRRRQQWLAIALLAVATLTLSSCANTLPQHTAAGTYTIQLQATGTSTNVTVPTTHAVSITLNVTPE